MRGVGGLRDASFDAQERSQQDDDEREYYEPREKRDPWEGIGYFWLALAAAVAGWLVWVLYSRLAS